MPLRFLSTGPACVPRVAQRHRAHHYPPPPPARCKPDVPVCSSPPVNLHSSLVAGRWAPAGIAGGRAAAAARRLRVAGGLFGSTTSTYTKPRNGIRLPPPGRATFHPTCHHLPSTIFCVLFSSMPFFHQLWTIPMPLLASTTACTCYDILQVGSRVLPAAFTRRWQTAGASNRRACLHSRVRGHAIIHYLLWV